MKTVFIVATRGYIIRNVLRSGVLDYLKHDYHVVIFIMSRKGQKIPNYLSNEFADKNITLEEVWESSRNNFYDKIHRLFSQFTALLVYTKTTWVYVRIGNPDIVKKQSRWIFLKGLLFSFLGKFNFLKKLARFMENKLSIFDSEYLEEFYDKYQPDLVFSTSVISKVDIAFLKEAKKRRIATVAMTKGWDHLAKRLLLVLPDKLIVQNNVLKNEAINFQKMEPSQLEVCGFPQFDWYRKKEILMDRDAYFNSIGLDPRKRLIFFGSEGVWAPDDHNVVDILVKFIRENKLAKDCCVLARPHYSDLRLERFDRFVGTKEVKVDDNITRSDFFSDTWDPSTEEMKKFVNSIYHCDMMITVASTLALDACCFDKPTIAVAFNVLFSPKTGKDLSSILYETSHYGEALSTGALDLVDNEDKLLQSINNYLMHPEHKHDERKALLDKLCYKVDGLSSYRIYQVMDNILKKRQ